MRISDWSSDVCSSDLNAIVEAVAGSGKSTTIIEAMKKVRGNSIFLAFNKAIADELKAKGVNARTFHSLVFSPVMRRSEEHTSELQSLMRISYAVFCLKKKKENKNKTKTSKQQNKLSGESTRT